MPPNKDPFTLVSGDKLSANFSGNMAEPTIVSNTPEEFHWKGSVMLGAFAGEHYFDFSKSTVTPGGTTFVHGENYNGWMTWMFDDWWLGVARGSVVQMYAGYAQDVKKRAEQLKERDSS